MRFFFVSSRLHPHSVWCGACILAGAIVLGKILGSIVLTLGCTLVPTPLDHKRKEAPCSANVIVKAGKCKCRELRTGYIILVGPQCD